MKKVAIHQWLFIEWQDSFGGGESWHHKDDVADWKPVTCKQVGYVIASTPKYIRVASCVSDNQYFGVMVIPTCSIQRISGYKPLNHKKGPFNGGLTKQQEDNTNA